MASGGNGRPGIHRAGEKVGAPFFIVDGEPFWGNDRKVQMERRLAGGPF